MDCVESARAQRDLRSFDGEADMLLRAPPDGNDDFPFLISGAQDVGDFARRGR
jgi:hypothetical protein